MAQQATTYRINRLAKDFNIKSKDILDILARVGLDGKTHMAILEPAEFNLFLETVTSENQISNIDDYVRGDAVIPRKTPKKKAEPEKKDTSAPESVGEEPVVEEPAKKEPPKTSETAKKVPEPPKTQPAKQQKQPTSQPKAEPESAKPQAQAESAQSQPSPVRGTPVLPNRNGASAGGDG